MSQLNGDNFAFSTLIKQSPTLEDIYKAYLKCRKNKRYKVASIKYEKNLWQNLAYLENAIKNFSYSASKPFVFSVKKPKPREIVAAKFTDRVAHHLLVSSLEEQVEKKLHPNCVACRKNRGNKKGNQILKKIFVSDDANKYYWLKLDIKNFFPSIHRETLFNLLKPYFNYNWQYFLAQQIIFQDFSNSIVLKSHKIYLDKLPKFRSLRYKSLDYGLPIGNLTSQFWANLYLNEMDHFIASQDFVFEYLRFVDDFIIFSKNKDKLISFKKNIIDFLKVKRHLQLKDPNAQILPTKYSLNFLGYIYRFKQKTVKKQVKKRLEARIKKFKKQERSKLILLKKNIIIFNLKESHRDHIVCSLASSYAHFKESDSQKWFITILKTAPFFKRWFIIKNQTLKDRFKFYKKSNLKAKSLVPGLKSFYYGQINLLKNSNQYFLLKGKNGVFLLGKLAELAGSYSYGTFNRLVNIDFANLYLSKNDFFILLNQLLKQKPEIEIAIIEKKSFPYWPYKSYFIENILVLKDEKWD